MPRLIFLLNRHLLAWAPSARYCRWTAARLACAITEGRIRLPRSLSRRVDIPPGVTFRALAHGRFVIAWPSRPLHLRMPARPSLTLEQQMILHLRRMGFTVRQTARHMRRTDRWVRLQQRRIRELVGLDALTRGRREEDLPRRREGAKEGG